jgi:hypothetical protein
MFTGAIRFGKTAQRFDARQSRSIPQIPRPHRVAGFA